MSLLLFHRQDFQPFTCLKFDTNDNIQNFLLTLKDQILTIKDAKDINFPRQLIQNKAKMSFLVPHDLVLSLEKLKW